MKHLKEYINESSHRSEHFVLFNGDTVTVYDGQLNEELIEEGKIWNWIKRKFKKWFNIGDDDDDDDLSKDQIDQLKDMHKSALDGDEDITSNIENQKPMATGRSTHNAFKLLYDYSKINNHLMPSYEHLYESDTMAMIEKSGCPVLFHEYNNAMIGICIINSQYDKSNEMWSKTVQKRGYEATLTNYGHLTLLEYIKDVPSEIFREIFNNKWKCNAFAIDRILRLPNMNKLSGLTCVLDKKYNEKLLLKLGFTEMLHVKFNSNHKYKTGRYVF